jgi:hypothetical protein
MNGATVAAADYKRAVAVITLRGALIQQRVSIAVKRREMCAAVARSACRANERLVVVNARVI